MKGLFVFSNLLFFLSFTNITNASDESCRWWIDTYKDYLHKLYANRDPKSSALKQQIDTYFWVMGLIKEQMETDQVEYPFIKNVLNSIKNNKLLSKDEKKVNKDYQIFLLYYDKLITKLNLKISWHACAKNTIHVSNEDYIFSDRCVTTNTLVSWDTVFSRNTYVDGIIAPLKKAKYYTHLIPEKYNTKQNKVLYDVSTVNSINGFLFLENRTMLLKLSPYLFIGVFPLDIDSVMKPRTMATLYKEMNLEYDYSFEEFALKQCKKSY